MLRWNKGELKRAFVKRTRRDAKACAQTDPRSDEP